MSGSSLHIAADCPSPFRLCPNRFQPCRNRPRIQCAKMEFTDHNRQIHAEVHNMLYRIHRVKSIAVDGKHIEVFPSLYKSRIGNPCPPHPKNHMIRINTPACFCRYFHITPYHLARKTPKIFFCSFRPCGSVCSGNRKIIKRTIGGVPCPIQTFNISIFPFQFRNKPLPAGARYRIVQHLIGNNQMIDKSPAGLIAQEISDHPWIIPPLSQTFRTIGRVLLIFRTEDIRKIPENFNFCFRKSLQ